MQSGAIFPEWKRTQSVFLYSFLQCFTLNKIDISVISTSYNFLALKCSRENYSNLKAFINPSDSVEVDIELKWSSRIIGKLYCWNHNWSCRRRFNAWFYSIDQASCDVWWVCCADVPIKGLDYLYSDRNDFSWQYFGYFRSFFCSVYQDIFSILVSGKMDHTGDMNFHFRLSPSISSFSDNGNLVKSINFEMNFEAQLISTESFFFQIILNIFLVSFKSVWTRIEQIIIQ